MKKIQIRFISVLLGTLVVVFLSGCGKETADYIEAESMTSETEVNSQLQEESVEQEIYVYICGQVQMPGVYILPEGSRICEAFVAAGGLTKEAATDYWNQARVLNDGEMIYVPTAEEVENSSIETQGEVQTGEGDKKKVNINTASKEELMTLPGVGETRALAILAYRQKNGSFTSIEDLKNVEGIKDGVFSKLKDYIVVN